ncbi:MAG: lipopolysaccharide heptosyltransferase II [Candidatus Rifleibacteriota bacterium]
MKTLFIGLNWLGDVIMSLPAMLAAAEKHEVHVLTRPHLVEAYQIIDRFAAVHAVATNGPIFAGLQKMRKLRKEGFDQIVVLPDSLRAALVSWACDAPSIGYNTQGRKLFLSQAIAKPVNFKEIHESTLHFNLVKEAGLADQQSPLPEICLDQSRVIETLCRFTLEPDEPFIILAPGAAFGAAKRWPPEKFAEVAEIIADRYPGLKILVSGSEAEHEIAQKTAARCNSVKSVAGRTSLTELAVLLSKARALIANDSGTMHLAALFRRPAIIPVGPTDMARTGALSEKTIYVYGSEKCPQAPCRLKTCPRPDHICMNSISAEKIAEVFSQMVGESL